MINDELADVRGIDTTTREHIQFLQNRLDMILNRHEMWHSPEEVAKVVESYEYVLQSLWGFPINRKFHRYNHMIKGCTCPKLDNDELVGWYEERWVSDGCPFHN